MNILKQIAAAMPESWQAELKRIHFARKIKRGTFLTGEAEFGLLDSLVKHGDWVIDVGANVGHYTKRLSDLAGPTGRVFAFEPVPATFQLLTANTARFQFQNVSLFNVATSGRFAVVGMNMPKFPTGLKNYHEASISRGGGEVEVVALRIDDIGIGQCPENC